MTSGRKNSVFWIIGMHIGVILQPQTQGNRESAPFSNGAIDADFSAHHGYDLFGYGKA